MKKLNSILLVDDDSSSNRLNQMLLEELGIAREIKVFEDGEDAFQDIKLSCFEGKCPDLILLDINMPIANGFDFLDACKFIEFQCKLNIYVLTSSVKKEDHEKVLSYNVSGILEKPLSEKSILDLCRTLPQFC